MHQLAIVTGASRGLGRAIATGLAEAGWDLVLDARGAPALTAVADALPGRVRALPGDITDPDHRERLVAAADELGGATLVVNNAGALGPTPLPGLAEYPVDALREVFEANVLAVLGLVQVALPGLRRRGGAVLTITSDAAVEPYEGWGGYGASKAAVELLSNVLSKEEPAIRVWWADPGDLRTQMHQDAFPGEDITDRPLPETVVPAVVHLVSTRPESGRIRLPEVAV
ncbi:NAD(P)-dependent dehydrogenase (short-subunit alcohol dehydrogenase family) [Actinokineospora baliensis]|uniref:SDR family NAD(P)-dependent oxidoreductase n=1 Tax=Actinokineospora baliensis TaxID=547056 RepID=UPI0027DD05A6|nr:SDR family oxidoreductase [Actinokineospora baliensis]MBM7772724.1 NAD(P)-dependent dehydrogenase (short-subunit alcohol dehydrogenase family) [Actinokineospora baliensis]